MLVVTKLVTSRTYCTIYNIVTFERLSYLYETIKLEQNFFSILNKKTPSESTSVNIVAEDDENNDDRQNLIHAGKSWRIRTLQSSAEFLVVTVQKYQPGMCLNTVQKALVRGYCSTALLSSAAILTPWWRHVNWVRIKPTDKKPPTPTRGTWPGSWPFHNSNNHTDKPLITLETVTLRCSVVFRFAWPHYVFPPECNPFCC